MPLPKVVQEAEARAEAARLANLERRGLAAAPTPPAPPDQPPAPPPPPLAPQPPAQPPTPPAAPPVAPADQQWEHRFNVLQGKYNAEVPRLTAQVRDLSHQTQELIRLNEQLQQQLAAVPKQSLVKPEEVAEYGEGLIDVARRIAREETAGYVSTIDQLRGELAQLKGGVANSQRLGFFETLNRDHADWHVVNNDDQFIQWLDQPVDPLVPSLTRQAVLTQAQNDNDGAAASAVFTAFKKARETWAANANAALASQAVPGQGTPPPQLPNPAARGRIITRAEVEAHYTKLRQRGYASMQEANAAEAEIQLANAEGRIR